MTATVALAVPVRVLFCVTAPPLARRMRPAVATRVLTLGALVIAGRMRSPRRCGTAGSR